MKRTFLGFLFLALASLAAHAADTTIDTAITTLEMHIKRDEAILARPANLAAVKQARAQLRDGLRELDFVINRFERHFGGTEPRMMEDLHRIRDEEEQEANTERLTHRFLENTRATVEKNLPTKKAILKRARELVYPEH